MRSPVPEELRKKNTPAGKAGGGVEGSAFIYLVAQLPVASAVR